VDVIITEAAQKFITPLTFQSLTGRPVYTDMWQPALGDALPTHIAHVGLGEGANLMLIAPATAHHIAKLAHGFADDLLCVTALALRCPLIVAPAMDGAMYENPAVAENVRRLTDRGVIVLEPEMGRHASGLAGRGRLPEVPTLIGVVRQHLGREWGWLRDRKIVVTAGGTREPIDPVRYVGNRSSGKQGYAIAQAAIDEGANVTLITTPTGLIAPIGAEVVTVETAGNMLEAVMNHIPDADALIMAAAVADFRPEKSADQKIKKTNADLDIHLVRTPDILHTVGQQRLKTGYPSVLVGFAAETRDLLKNARSKLEKKNVDYIIANDVFAPGAGFQGDTNIVTILGADGSSVSLPQLSKSAVAQAILQRVITRLQTVPHRIRDTSDVRE
jgi:phosphopantothenoylcysteine decarboxylase / phosphopantothenate---cysteine ligase